MPFAIKFMCNNRVCVIILRSEAGLHFDQSDLFSTQAVPPCLTVLFHRATVQYTPVGVYCTVPGTSTFDTFLTVISRQQLEGNQFFFGTVSV